MPRELLCRHPLFALLTAGELDDCLAESREVSLATGETVFQEGSFGTWGYLVLAGRVRIFRSPDGQREVSLGAVGPGEIFGDYAILSPHINTASCRVAESARPLRLPLLKLRQMVSKLPGVEKNLKNWLRLQALANYLNDRSFLGFMSAPSALALHDHLRLQSFQAQHTIQASGLSADHWYFIESGQVELRAEDNDSAGPARLLGAGDSFGVPALLGREELPVAFALAETRCLALPRASFVPQVADHSLQSLQTFKPQVDGKYPWVGQQSAADCGAAALAMIAQAFELKISADSVRQGLPTIAAGASLSELQAAAAAIGLRCQAVQISLDQLRQTKLPAIAHLSEGHYVVVYEYQIGSGVIVIGDPECGIVKWSSTLFGQNCSGNMLLFLPPRAGTA